MVTIPIAFVIDTIESPTAGTEKQLLRVIENIDRRQFKSLFCYLYESDWIRKNLDLCTSYEIGTRSPLRPTSWAKIIRLAFFFHRNRVQIVQTFFRDANIAGIIAGRLANVPVIISSRRNKGYWQTSSELLILKILNLLVTRFLANSKDVRKYTHDVEGIPLERIDVIYNGFDFNQLTKETFEVRSKAKKVLEIPEDTLVAVAVANLRPIKGTEVLINALPSVIKQVPNFVLLLVGDGNERPKLEGLVRNLELGDTVRFLGTRTDVMEILSACDLGVLSSHSESLSNSIIEYMASGLSVVATDVGGTREMVIHGENGLLVPVGDSKALGKAMIQILVDAKLRIKMGRRSREIAQNRFSLEGCIKEHEDYYLKFLAKNKRRIQKA
ncbi:MAG: glycosyltransferase [Deltaproteobacteria bacterium]|nr:glycosyltransferase [Deltaproteobacteria bacterium]